MKKKNEVLLTEDNSEKLETLCELAAGISLEKIEYFEDLSSKENNKFICSMCPALFSREGDMRNHLNSKHNKFPPLKCNVC